MRTSPDELRRAAAETIKKAARKALDVLTHAGVITLPPLCDGEAIVYSACPPWLVDFEENMIIQELKEVEVASIGQ